VRAAAIAGSRLFGEQCRQVLVLELVRRRGSGNVIWKSFSRKQVTLGRRALPPVKAISRGCSRCHSVR
jgi:hypothetical protein